MLMLAVLATLSLSLLAVGCAKQNAEAQNALDSATEHLAKDNELYRVEMEQAAAWREAYVATLGGPNFGSGMAETVSFLDGVDQAIDSRLTELEAARADLDAVAEMEADARYKESARLLSAIVDGEIAYCDKHQEYVAGARRLSEGAYPPDEAELEALEALRLELAELSDAIDADYEAAAAFLNAKDQ